MSITLIVIRLEICENSEKFKDIYYKAGSFVLPTDQEHTPTGIIDTDTGHLVKGYDNLRSLNDVNRGQREYRELILETYIDIGLENTETCNSGERESSDAPMTQEVENITSDCITLVDNADSSGYLSSVGSERYSHSEDTQSNLDQTSRQGPSWHKIPSSRLSPTVHYFSGNPSVEVTKGILHLYKDNNTFSMSNSDSRSEMICILSVPAAYTIHDLIQFLAPVSVSVEYMRIIRDAKPNDYMVLVKFKSQVSADEFYDTYNTMPFNTIENYICHLVYVAKVETMKAEEGASLPAVGLTELPNCPVCLERMDESVDGILTILCNHSFHITCLDQCLDTTCPVCRYMQTPEQSADNRCLECGSQESLWICLICGHVGCGRYLEMHAYRHFQETHHCYSMHLGNNHVWDYAGDNYVHRLVQNKTDGKLVEVDEGGNVMREEKLDSLNLEYTYLLTSQLESQRMYFEDKISKIESDARKELELMQTSYDEQMEKFVSLEQRYSDIMKEKQAFEKKYTQLHGRTKKLMNDLQDEKELNKSLLDNQKEWRDNVITLQTQLEEVTETKNREVKQLEEELRDVLFHIEAQQKLEDTDLVSQEEIQDSQVSVGAASQLQIKKDRRLRKKGR